MLKRLMTTGHLHSEEYHRNDRLRYHHQLHKAHMAGPAQKTVKIRRDRKQKEQKTTKILLAKSGH